MIKEKKRLNLKDKKEDIQYITPPNNPILVEDLTSCLVYLKDLKNKKNITEEEYNFLIKLGITRFTNYKIEKKILKPLEKLSDKILTKV